MLASSQRVKYVVGDGDPVTTSPSISTKLFFGMAGLRQLEPAWRDLEGRVDKLAYYHAFRWYEAALESGLIEESSTIFVTASNSEKLIGILPLRQVREWNFFMPCNFLCFLDSPHMILRDAILDREWASRFSMADVATWLRKESRLRWDTLVCNLMPADGGLATLRAGSRSLLQVDFQTAGSSIIPCSGKTSQNLEHIPTRFRRNLRRLKRKAEKIGPVKLYSYTGEPELNAAYQKFINIEHSGWKKSDGGSIASTAETTKFYRALASSQDNDMNCRIYLLKIGDETVAGQFGFVSHGVFYLLKIAYREEYADVGPGMVLLNLVIDDFSKSTEAIQINLVTNPAWSAPWKATEEPTRTLQLFNYTPAGLLLYCQTVLIEFSRKIRLIISARNSKTT